ncbi:hypothetical protein WH50_11545 [Pokkaliibacter plantistimulans]|uniref:Uncharacterized protein n=1 Tax=Pokkaliibacter plantistimulans TaxID=1635171 RepID=A0ABX5LWV5_9GAMM|nr:DUF692 domain-containing protein [Pokkaliibacter plantistimulans]PXF31150.1 hypothetical protein WH50_11545 [Pokkaliibacter plantistimulans]
MSAFPSCSLPATPPPSPGFGVGLRSCHFPWLERHLLPQQSGVDWFEAITENYLDHYGYARRMLFRLREHYPIVLHGVSLSIGASEPLDAAYLHKLRQLASELQPAWISDHLCWTGMLGINSHDLLPLPLTRESLDHVCARVQQVQDYLSRPLVLENPSTYFCFQQNEYHEWEFLAELVRRSGCQLLVDVNNIYVSSVNLGFDPQQYLAGLPLQAVAQCHLAGPSDMGTHLIDTHDQPVPTAVWRLYQQLISACERPVATLLEWDARIPDFPELVAELNLAREVLQGHIPQREMAVAASSLSTPVAASVGRELHIAEPLS